MKTIKDNSRKLEAIQR